MKPELEKAIKILLTELKSDSQYRYSWVANIAMAYKDTERWYKEKTGKKFLNKKDKHIIANKAAEYFIEQLCQE